MLIEVVDLPSEALGLEITIIFLFSFFNTTIKNEDDVKNNYNLTVLGNIPDFVSASQDKKHKYYSYSKGGGSANGKQ